MTAGRGQLGILTDADVRAAQAVLDALTEVAATASTAGEYQLEARGVLAGWAADVRWAGYQEGKATARQEVIREAVEALEELR